MDLIANDGEAVIEVSKEQSRSYPASRGLFDLPRSVGKRKRPLFFSSSSRLILEDRRDLCSQGNPIPNKESKQFGKIDSVHF